MDPFVNAPGFLEARLHRNTGLDNETIQFVHVALWDHADIYHASFTHFTPAGKQISGVQAHPGLYEVVETLKAGQQLPRTAG